MSVNKTWVRIGRWLLLLGIAIAWLTRHGGSTWHEWPGYLVMLLAIAALFTSPSYVLTALFVAAITVGASGALLTTAQLWGASWLNALHEVTGAITLGLLLTYLVAKLLGRDQQLQNFLATVFQRRKRMR